MAFNHAVMRPFPTLSWARPASLLIAGTELAAQVFDVSATGCKILPKRLEGLHEIGLRLGDTITAVVDGRRRDGVVAWATPNLSALGCRFN